MVISTPSAIHKKYVTTETDTKGYINAYLTISFNGETYTNLDYAVYFTFYQTPTVARSFLYFGDTAKKNGNSYKYVPYGTSGTFEDAHTYTPISVADQSGVYDDPDGERHQLYVYLNGTGVFLRSSKLVCIFVECGKECSDSQADDITGCRAAGTCKIETAVVYRTESSNDFVSVTSKSQWYDTLEFGCKMPALSNGQVRVTFSNNRFLGDDYALEYTSTGEPGEGEERISSITSLPCNVGYFAANTAAPCAKCPAGTFDMNDGLGSSCSKVSELDLRPPRTRSSNKTSAFYHCLIPASLTSLLHARPHIIPSPPPPPSAQATTTTPRQRRPRAQRAHRTQRPTRAAPSRSTSASAPKATTRTTAPPRTP